MRNPVTRLLLLLCLLLLLSACYEAGPSEFVVTGHPERGEDALESYGCGACHIIPGVVGANSTVGPSLSDWPERLYIAGTLTNTPDNLIYWIQFPQEIAPGTAMPNLGVTEQDARDIAAYLYRLR